MPNLTPSAAIADVQNHAVNLRTVHVVPKGHRCRIQRTQVNEGTEDMR